MPGTGPRSNHSPVGVTLKVDAVTARDVPQLAILIAERSNVPLLILMLAAIENVANGLISAVLSVHAKIDLRLVLQMNIVSSSQNDLELGPTIAKVGLELA